jgi:hypothetical protein
MDSEDDSQGSSGSGEDDGAESWAWPLPPLPDLSVSCCQTDLIPSQWKVIEVS